MEDKQDKEKPVQNQGYHALPQGQTPVYWNLKGVMQRRMHSVMLIFKPKVKK